jgi:hypothetical protein
MNETVDPNFVVWSGVMRKLGGVRDGRGGNWKQRYFVLTEVLSYYADGELVGVRIISFYFMTNNSIIN